MIKELNLKKILLELILIQNDSISNVYCNIVPMVVYR